MKIGVVGAGRMGRPIASRLARAGHGVTVLTRTPALQQAWGEEQVSWASTIEETVGQADAVFVVVLEDEQVRSVCLGPQGALAHMKPGATLVQHTTCDPGTVARIGEEGRSLGIHVLDAALSGGPHDIAVGKLTLWVGGDEATFAQMTPLLSAYASPILFVGSVGNGQRVKLVNNALFVAQVGLALDAVRLGSSLGIEEVAILAALQHGSGASRALGIVAQGGSARSVGARIGALMSKDVGMVRE